MLHTLQIPIKENLKNIEKNCIKYWQFSFNVGKSQVKIKILHVCKIFKTYHCWHAQKKLRTMREFKTASTAVDD